MKKLNQVENTTIINEVELYEIIEKQAPFHFRNFPQLACRMELEDFTMELYTNFLKREAHKSYNPTKGAKTTFVKNVSKNMLIDMVRRIKIDEVFDKTTSNKDGDEVSMFDLFKDSTNIQLEVEQSSLINDIKEYIDQNDSKKSTVIMRTPLGEFKYNKRTIIDLLLLDYQSGQIAKMCFKSNGDNVTTAYISKTLRQIKEEVQEYLFFIENHC